MTIVKRSAINRTNKVVILCKGLKYMLLSQRADYAVRAMVYIAIQEKGKRVQIREAADKQEAPEPFLAKIVQALAVAGLVDTQRGAGGGIALARPAQDITLLQIVEAAEGPIALTRCTYEPGRCPRMERCAVHPVWERVQRVLETHLAAIRLSELAESQRKLTMAA
ncbi:MAG: Rrf2 family transcriptional regulator [Chloroflexi bacterium]|nr:Rrf2 family transcriptional regulator [Chloroflexota bacterium]